LKFVETKLPGVYVLELERLEDERGFFARTWCAEELAAHGLDPRVAQCDVSFNGKKGTLRGIHYQAAPHEETKLVRCTMGAVYDVAVDLRDTSPAFRRWVGVELSAANRKALYLPAGCAHGFVTLTDDAELLYLMGSAYVGGAARGVRWNDARLGIDWPLQPTVISERDAGWPLLD
jgi:dTDP-4-dehydrorhamnose 3,5-epimerase